MYLDNAATTKIHPEVLKVMHNAPFANYNAKYYEEAEDAKKTINNAIKTMAELLCVDYKNLVITSGATESNNFIIKGFYQNYPKAHFITSKREHKSVLAVFEYLESIGADVSYIDTLDEVITFKHIKPLIKGNTKLVSIMSVNNETGIINDVEVIAQELQRLGIKFHTDAVQALGKVKLDYRLFDYVSFSSHKIYGPKGIGLAVVDREIQPLIHGSDQQHGYRAGTLANELIVGFAKAFELALGDIAKNLIKYQQQREIITRFLTDNLGEDLIINFNENNVFNIISIQIKGEMNQTFLKENHEVIKASTGSSCSVTAPSYVLKDHGFSDEAIRQTIRISLSIYDEYDMEIS